MGPDANKLVYQAARAHDGPVIHLYLTCQPCVAAQDHPVLQNTIVGNMHIGHDQAILSHHSPVVGFGPLVNGYKLTDNGIIPNLNSGNLPFKL